MSDPSRTTEPRGSGQDHGRGGFFSRVRSLWADPSYRFAALFLTFLTGIALGYPALRLRFGHQFAAFEGFTATLVYQLLVRSGCEATLRPNNIVSLGHFPVAIIDECTGVYEAVLLGAALLAFPTSWGRIALGFLMGFPLIYAMNVARIVMLLFVGRDVPKAFDFMHVYFWQVTMIAMVSTTWLVWVLWVVRGGEDRAAPGTHCGGESKAPPPPQNVKRDRDPY